MTNRIVVLMLLIGSGLSVLPTEGAAQEQVARVEVEVVLLGELPVPGRSVVRSQDGKLSLLLAEDGADPEALMSGVRAIQALLQAGVPAGGERYFRVARAEFQLSAAQGQRARRFLELLRLEEPKEVDGRGRVRTRPMVVQARTGGR